jgi:sugar (pentulose or hexulose) kinase
VAALPTTYLGIDLGTRSVRVGLYATTGELVSSSEMAVATVHPRPGWAEQSPAQVLDALGRAVRSVTFGGVRPAAVSVASTAVTTVAVDGADRPIGSALLWMDTRAEAEAEEITATGHAILANTGGRVSPEWMLPKLLWLARHDSERLRAARRVVDVHDWVIFNLTGRWSLARATIIAEWCYDPGSDSWPGDLLAELGVGGAVAGWDVPRLDPGAPAGAVTAEAAALTGLAVGTPVAQGTMDSYAAALACDIYRPGRIAMSIGTSSSYVGLTETPVLHPALLGPVPDSFGSGTFAQQGGQTSAAAVVEWFSEQLAPGVPLTQLDAEAEQVAPGAEGVWALDTWQGSRTPRRDPSLRGQWGGLTLAHRRAHLYRALLEAVAFGGRCVLDTLEHAGVKSTELVVVGGGARSDLWMQIHTAILGQPLLQLRASQPVTLGAAMCAAVNDGAYGDLPHAAAAMSHTKPGWLPDPYKQAAYEALYHRYLLRIADA